MRVAFKESDITTHVINVRRAEIKEKDKNGTFNIVVYGEDLLLMVEDLNHSNVNDELMYTNLIELGYLDLTERSNISISWKKGRWQTL